MSETMLDYIREQPSALRRVLEHRREDTKPFVEDFLQIRPDRIYLIGSGSSLNASKAAAPLMEAMLGVEVTPTAASAPPVFRGERPYLVFISQGGNSTNTVAAIRRHEMYPHIALTGSEKCTINEIARHILFRCGEEKAGPKTKGYISTFFELYCMALEAGHASGMLADAAYEEKEKAAEQEIASMEDYVRAAEAWFADNADEIAKIEKCVVIGKGVGQAAALEGALKLQETMLIPASGYEFEEFLHGPDMALDGKMAGLYLMPPKSDPDYSRFEGLIAYHRKKCPYVYTVGGALGTSRDLDAGADAHGDLRLLSWCLPSQIMGARIPAMTGREGRGTQIFWELDKVVGIKAKYQSQE